MSKKRKKTKVLIAVVLGIVVLSDFLVSRHHPHFIWDEIPGFYALYGLFSCIVIVLVSKFIGHHGLMKKEDYYD